jgi:hypothetical protein
VNVIKNNIYINYKMIYSRNTKTGILGDENWHKNCHEYHAFSTGFANATFNGQLMNPYLNGVKTPKYQRSAPKASADVEAVNNSRFMKGAPSVNAGRLLKGYIDEAKAFSPPPVNIPNALGNARRLAETLVARGDLSPETADETYDRLVGSVSGPIRRSQITENRGDAITKQTVSDEARNPMWDLYLSRFLSMSLEDKRQIMTNMMTAMRVEGINPEKYEPQGGGRLLSIVKKLRPETGMLSRMLAMLQTASARGARIDLDEVFMVPTEEQIEYSLEASITALAEIDYALAEEAAKQSGMTMGEAMGPPQTKRSESMQTKTGTSETATSVSAAPREGETSYAVAGAGVGGGPRQGTPLTSESSLATKGQQK